MHYLVRHALTIDLLFYSTMVQCFFLKKEKCYSSADNYFCLRILLHIRIVYRVARCYFPIEIDESFCQDSCNQWFTRMEKPHHLQNVTENRRKYAICSNFDLYFYVYYLLHTLRSLWQIFTQVYFIWFGYVLINYS